MDVNTASVRPELSIIVVSHQGRERVLQILRAAHQSVGPIDVEWFLVDSGSTDGTADAVRREFPHIDVVERPNIGFAAGNNIALSRARGRYALLLNPDMEIVSGTLAELVELMDAHPEVGIGSAVTYYPDGELHTTMRRFPSPTRQFGEALMLTRLELFKSLQEDDRREAHYGTERSADWVAGGFLLVRREVFEQVGGLDERFFLFSEETDWCRRVRSAGWDIRHFPHMRLTHHTGRSMRPDLYAQNSHSKLLYARKHFSPVRAFGFRVAIALRHALRYAGFAPQARRKPDLRPRAEAERRALLVVLGLSAPPHRPYTGH
jgi:N-acetylglucosaminyl-diphospho-decaprenol L-rhamnosyltransferase